MRAWWFALLVTILPRVAAADDDDAPKTWIAGEHVSGDWAGNRDKLEDHGIQIDAVYAAEAFSTLNHGSEALGHLDAAITLDTEKLGLWHGGTFFALGQNGHGTGINDDVGSAATVSNLEAEPYTQLTELFYEHHAFDDAISFRIGKQDANRDFGTPRFGGNFLNNNFGMFPNSPLPSYPTTGLGAIVTVHPVEAIGLKAGVYEGNPQVGGFGLSNAFEDGNGYVLIGAVAATHRYGPEDRHEGTTSLGVWHQKGTFDAIDPLPGMPATYDGNDGFFIQNDEHVFAHPANPKDPSGLTLILRFAWARPDRNEISRYAGGSAAWHGLGFRRDDTVGIGFGYFTVAHPLNGGTGPSDEWFLEGSYKWRLTRFFSLQPDVQFYRHPGGDGRDAVLVGGRVKVKL
jgi:porin